MVQPRAVAKRGRSFVPALGWGWLTGFYDPVVRLTTRESTVKRALLTAAQLRGARTVLDVGCGTGTLLVSAGTQRPDLDLVGIDIDPRVLAIGHEKTRKAGARIALVRASADGLPFEDGSFDRAVSSLFFHHLDRLTKEAVAAELLRVLVPGGELHVADWGPAANVLMRVLFLPVRMLDGLTNTRDNVRGELPRIFETAGFENVGTGRRFATVFGTLALSHGRRPDA